MATNFKIVRNKNAKSAVWQHFGFIKDTSSNNEVDKKKVGCMICFATLKYSGNTTNLTDHLRRKHQNVTTEIPSGSQ